MSQPEIYNKNNILAALTAQAGPRVTKAIQTASAKTGVDFAYLMTQANTESSFNAGAKTKSSSAKGLYQFIESTWLQMVRDHGDKHGLGHYARMIDKKGRVDSSAIRQQILNLRTNPEKSALLAAEYASDNKDYLKRTLGADKEIGSTELYLAHFMGPSGAAGFLKAQERSPHMTAAYIFPREARANPNIFYEGGTGRARSIQEIYANFDNKIEGPQEAPEIYVAEVKDAPRSFIEPTTRDAGFALSGSTHIDTEKLDQNYAFRNILAAREANDFALPSFRIRNEDPFSALRDSERILSQSEIMIFAQSRKNT